MLSKVTSFALAGLEGVSVEVETDIHSGLPGYELVGLPDAAVRESRERVRSALKNSGKNFPARKVTVNLAPADLRKEGSYFDLAIAVGILAATGQLEPTYAAGYVFLGELALDGALRPVAGILPLLISAKAAGYKKVVIPAGNAGEAAYIEGIDTYAASSLSQAIDHLSGFAPLPPLPVARYGPPRRPAGKVRSLLRQGAGGRQARARGRRQRQPQPAARRPARRRQDHARPLHPRRHARHDL